MSKSQWRFIREQAFSRRLSLYCEYVFHSLIS